MYPQRSQRRVYSSFHSVLRVAGLGMHNSTAACSIGFSFAECDVKEHQPRRIGADAVVVDFCRSGSLWTAVGVDAQEERDVGEVEVGVVVEIR